MTKSKYPEKKSKANPSNKSGNSGNSGKLPKQDTPIGPQPIRGTNYYKCGMFKIADTICECGNCYTNLPENNPLQADTNMQALIHVSLDTSDRKTLIRNLFSHETSTRLAEHMTKYLAVEALSNQAGVQDPHLKKAFLNAIEKDFDVQTVKQALVLYSKMLEAVNSTFEKEVKTH